MTAEPILTTTDLKYKIPFLNSVSWQKQVKKGYFMKGAIKAAKGAACARCGHTSFKSVEDEYLNFNVPKCEKCFGPPDKLKVRKTIPSLDGAGTSKDFYRDLDGNLLTKISSAMALIGKLNDELKEGTFRPQDYDKKSQDRLKFSNFAKEYIKWTNDRYALPEGHEDRITYKSRLGIIRLIEKELVPFFKDTPITDIDKFYIQEFRRSYISKFRTRDLAMGELRTMLRFAFNQLGLLEKLPAFPVIPKARQLRVDEIPTKDVQVEIINNIDKPKYKAMYIVMATLGVRPCEVRSYRVGDLDLKKKLIITKRHFSGKVEEIGRKSIENDDSMGTLIHKLDDNLIQILTPFVFGRSADEYLFSGERNDYVSETALADAWIRSTTKLELKFKPYAGTKSASATDMIKRGESLEKVRALLGHKNSKTTEIYAKIAAIDTESLIDSSMFTWGSDGVLDNGTGCKVINIKR